jgi:hypothetical protein
LLCQLHGLPLKVNQVPSGREFQRRESKSRHDSNVRSRINQNSAKCGLPLLSRDVNCCPSFRGFPIHINPQLTRTSDCSDRMTPNQTEEQRPSTIEDAIHVDSHALRNHNHSNVDDFIKRLSGVSISNSRLKSIGITQSPKIMRSRFRSAKNRTHFALWREHVQHRGVS